MLKLSLNTTKPSYDHCLFISIGKEKRNRIAYFFLEKNKIDKKYFFSLQVKLTLSELIVFFPTTPECDALRV